MKGDNAKKLWALYLLNFIIALRQASERLDKVAAAYERRGDSLCVLVKVYFALTQTRPEWPLATQKFTRVLLDSCVALPPLSSERAVINQWWSMGYELLMLNTDGKPEQLEQLHEIGKNREKHYSGLKVTKTGDYYKPKSVKSNIRAKILTDLKEEFERIPRQWVKAAPLGASVSDAAYRAREK